ncbi:hypothetical protein A9Q84_01225 [Halobacteriovorax marinus]|uniref:Ketoreductase domain-containing protein n=1 Tax=Halobacteriovorax marinus TaxID=97084 RepID=A0A1Y5FHL3_9BACT|nr:hypothetical protein A9Q84_01225 [Halobacteriovorax marinus]
MPLKNHVVIVTGGSAGIGFAVAKRLASDGYHILINYNSNKDGALACQSEINELDGACSILQFNVKDREQCESALEGFLAENPDLSIYGLVNNAGITRDTLAGLMSDDDFRDVVETNMFGSFYLMRWCAKKMLLKKRGAIVNMSSLSGQVGNGGQLNYAASKAGIIAMTKSLANEVGRRGIRVNAVAPGIIETKMTAEIPFLDQMKKNIPLKRIGKPEEVASVVSFLISNEASYMTGQTLSVNGGLYFS